MNLLHNYSNIQPQFVACEKYLGQRVYTINFDIEEIHDDMYQFRYHSVTLPIGKFDRATVISTIIRNRYRDDEMQAIINNYLLDPNDGEAIREFDEMQEYRRYAKNIADQFLQEIA